MPQQRHANVHLLKFSVVWRIATYPVPFLNKIVMHVCYCNICRQVPTIGGMLASIMRYCWMVRLRFHMFPNGCSLNFAWASLATPSISECNVNLLMIGIYWTKSLRNNAVVCLFEPQSSQEEGFARCLKNALTVLKAVFICIYSGAWWSVREFVGFASGIFFLMHWATNALRRPQFIVQNVLLIWFLTSSLIFRGHLIWTFKNLNMTL